MSDFFGPPIHTYSRADAIRDGVLVDVTDTAAEAGFKVPVALTAAAHLDTVAWNADHGAHQDEAGRLWDVLTMARQAAGWQPGGQRVTFQVLRVPNHCAAEAPELVALDLHIGPGDTGEPVITILLPEED